MTSRTFSAVETGQVLPHIYAEPIETNAAGACFLGAASTEMILWLAGQRVHRADHVVVWIHGLTVHFLGAIVAGTAAWTLGRRVITRENVSLSVKRSADCHALDTLHVTSDIVIGLFKHVCMRPGKCNNLVATGVIAAKFSIGVYR